MSDGKVPEWLRARWERTKCETAARVQAAVDQLRERGRGVTFESIRETIRSMHGVSISANTIKRNELAYRSIRPIDRGQKWHPCRNRRFERWSPTPQTKIVTVCSPRSHAFGANQRTPWSLSWFPWNTPPRSREMSRIGCAKRFFA